MAVSCVGFWLEPGKRGLPLENVTNVVTVIDLVLVGGKTEFS